MVIPLSDELDLVVSRSKKRVNVYSTDDREGFGFMEYRYKKPLTNEEIDLIKKEVIERFLTE